MEHINSHLFLQDAVIFLAAALLGLLIFRRLGLGSVLGFLFAGVLIGPWGLDFMSSPTVVLGFSEIGVVLLLFIIGLEVQPKRLWESRKQLLALGTSQWFISGLLIFCLAMLLGLDWAPAALLGLILALSSTAFALQMLAERNELSKPHGRQGFSVLLFQDLAVIPLLVLIALLGQESGGLSWKPLAGIGLIILLALSARHVLRPMLKFVARSKSPEAFTGVALLLVFAVAVAMDAAELSMALGAFVAGILLADSEYRHELEAAIEPFKGLLMGLFFVAVGASIELGLLAEKPWVVTALVIALVVIKSSVLYALGRFNGLNHAGAITLGLVLCQGGEFAFLLLAEMNNQQIIPLADSQLLVLVVSLSMAATPLLLWVFDNFIAKRLNKPESQNFDTIEDHRPQVIIAGFGRFGQIIGRVLSIRKINYVALDSDPTQVELVKRFGNEVYYGDVTRLELLRAAGAADAKLLVLALENVDSSLHLAEIVCPSFPNLKVFARARNREHANRLKKLGCHMVTREMYASSLEMAKATLAEIGLTESAAANTVRLFRQHDEDLLQEAMEHVDDIDKRIEMAKQSQKQLADLFASDEEAGT